MVLINRFIQIIRANINHWLQNSEDPEKILQKTVTEMEENIIKLRQATAVAIAAQKRTERQYNQAESTAEEWYNRAQLALQQGNESLARSALIKRQVYKETVKSLESQVQEQSHLVTKLKNDMRSLELKMAEVKAKKDMYIARARSAEATYKLQEMLDGLSGSPNQKAFEQMEEKVIQLEAQAQATTVTNTSQPNVDFDVDAELAKLKQQE